MFVIGLILLIVLCFGAMFVEGHTIDRRYNHHLVPGLIRSFLYVLTLMLVAGVIIGVLVGYLMFAEIG